MIRTISVIPWKGASDAIDGSIGKLLDIHEYLVVQLQHVKGHSNISIHQEEVLFDGWEEVC